MADGAIFDWVCDQIEQNTSLTRIEARGTLRLALKAAGLAAQSLSSDQTKVVLTKVMPSELDARGVEEATQICEQICSDLAGVEFAQPQVADEPEAVFARLGGAS